VSFEDFNAVLLKYDDYTKLEPKVRTILHEYYLFKVR